jgi:hypothetical protein
MRRVGDVIGFVLAIPLLALIVFAMWRVWHWVGFGFLMLWVALALIAVVVVTLRATWRAFSRAVVNTAAAERNRASLARSEEITNREDRAPTRG